jgi:hypothetical protein
MTTVLSLQKLPTAPSNVGVDSLSISSCGSSSCNINTGE